MAHFAEIDENNVVVHVLVVDNEHLLDGNGNESEAVGLAFLARIFGDARRFVQTSYNHNFRGRYAAIGMIYDPQLDEFVRPPEEGRTP